MEHIEFNGVILNPIPILRSPDPTAHNAYDVRSEQDYGSLRKI